MHYFARNEATTMSSRRASIAWWFALKNLQLIVDDQGCFLGKFSRGRRAHLLA
jgi:hypothetical protein